MHVLPPVRLVGTDDPVHDDRMTAPATQARLDHIIPFFIVRDVIESIAFYRDRLGFEVSFLGPEGDPYFAIVQRDGAGVMLKAITPEVQPMPNPRRHEWARWDAYVHVEDPDALAAELTARGVPFRDPLRVNGDQLRGFEIADVDGYVLYFGRPESPIIREAPAGSTRRGEAT